MKRTVAWDEGQDSTSLYAGPPEMGTNTTVPPTELSDEEWGGGGGSHTRHSQMNRSGVSGKRRCGKKRASRPGTCEKGHGIR